MRTRVLARLETLVASVLVAIWVLPPFIMDVGSGLDPSWGLGLHQAQHLSLAFGRDIVHTYGPLGYLVQPVIAFPAQGLAAAWLRFPIVVGVAWFAFVRLRSVLPRPIALLAAVPIVWAIIGPQVFGGDVPGLLIVLGTAAGVERLGSPVAQISLRASAAAAMIATVGLLVKADVGFVALAGLILFLVCAGIAESAWRGAFARIGVALVAATASLPLFWLAVGQPLATLGTWMRLLLQVVAGHNSAMAADNGRSWWGVVVALALVVLGILAALAWPGLGRRRVAAAAVFTVLMVLLAAKQAFLRSDSGHLQRLLAVAVALTLVLGTAFRSDVVGFAQPSKPRRQIMQRLVAAVLAGSLVTLVGSVNGVKGLPFLDGRKGWRSARYLGDMTVSSQRRSSLVDWGHAAQPTVLKVPPSMIARIGTKTVHIEPWDAAVAWVYKLRWHPLPVFQSYMAYTDGLDQLNSAALAAENGPQAVLHQSVAIDGRIPRFESPSANVALLCNFEMAETGEGWNLFLRLPHSRCGTHRGLGTFTAREGQLVQVPASTLDDLVIARFQGLEPRLVGRLRELILRPRPVTLRIEGNPVAHRFVVNTQGSDHIVRLPRCLQGQLGTYDTSSFDSFTLGSSAASPSLLGEAYQVTFEAITLRC